MYNDMDYVAFEALNNDYLDFWEMSEMLTNEEISLYYDESDEV